MSPRTPLISVLLASLVLLAILPSATPFRIQFTNTKLRSPRLYRRLLLHFPSSLASVIGGSGSIVPPAERDARGGSAGTSATTDDAESEDVATTSSGSDKWGWGWGWDWYKGEKQHDRHKPCQSHRRHHHGYHGDHPTRDHPNHWDRDDDCEDEAPGSDPAPEFDEDGQNDDDWHGDAASDSFLPVPFTCPAPEPASCDFVFDGLTRELPDVTISTNTRNGTDVLAQPLVSIVGGAQSEVSDARGDSSGVVCTAEAAVGGRQVRRVPPKRPEIVKLPEGVFRITESNKLAYSGDNTGWMNSVLPLGLGVRKDGVVVRLEIQSATVNVFGVSTKITNRRVGSVAAPPGHYLPRDRMCVLFRVKLALV